MSLMGCMMMEKWFEFNIKTKEKHFKYNISKYLLMKKITTFFVLLLILIYGCARDPVCGECEYLKNHQCIKYECCTDEDCIGEQTCDNHKCVNPICGKCQYLQNHRCIDYECCSDSDCAENEECVNNNCQTVICQGCTYIKNHYCFDAECCTDSDCKDNDINTKDKCLYPKTEDSKCENIANTCEDGTPWNECNENGEYCVPPGILGFSPEKCGCAPGEREIEGGCTKDPALLGSIKILLVEVTQPDIEYQTVEGFTFIDFLNNQEGYKYLDEPYGYNVYSLNYIDDWFENEANKYGASVNVDIDLIGPVITSNEPPKRKANDPCDMLQPYFDSISEDEGIDLSNYDSISYLYLHTGGEHFWSCASPSRRNYVDIQAVDTLTVQTFADIEVVIHETTHMFGASDKYIAGGFTCREPKGVPDPDKYPQEKACIMCGVIMTEKGGSGWKPDDLNKLVICDKTAQEIGWKP